MFFSGSSRNHRPQGKATIERGKRCQPWFGVQRSSRKESFEASFIKNTNVGLLCLVYLVCFVCLVDLVHLVSFVQPNKRDRPDKPNNRYELFLR